MSRSLGEGCVIEICKTYGFINDEKLGRVYFPHGAANVHEQCSDLRFKFRIGDHVIFTALKQPDVKNYSTYMASAVVKAEELKEKTGKITEKSDKFCYVDLPREGRVFVPYSARNAIGKSWLGRGSEVGVYVNIKYFAQPVINDCHFVAFTCEVRESVNPATMKPVASQGGAHRSPEFVHEQVGCIVVWHGSCGESQVYSSVTGLAALPSSSIQPYMKHGSWIRYIAMRNPNQNEKISWIVSSPHDLGMLFESIPYNLDKTRLQLKLNAVVNRVDRKTRAAWMWNDQIGRIYVPTLSFRPSLRPFDSANITVCYTGHFEDVPWSAVAIVELGEDETVRDAVALMLHTCDTWRVSHVQIAQGTFYSFLEHDTFGSAFAAWTDYTSGDQPPKQGMPCRVTVYRQERDKKHTYRAVMVTPLDPSSKEPLHHHPRFSPGTKVPNGLSIPLPKAWKEPAAAAAAAARPVSPPGLNGVATRPAAASVFNGGVQQARSMSEVVSGIRRRATIEEQQPQLHQQQLMDERPASNGSVFTPPLSQVTQLNGFFHSNGCDLSPVIGNGTAHYGGSRDSPADSSTHHSDHLEMLSAMDLNGIGLNGREEYFDRSIASPMSDAFHPHYYPLSSAEDHSFDAWRPQGDLSSHEILSDHLAPLAPGFRSNNMGNSSVSTVSTTTSVDAETQTEMMNEHKVLRDIIAKPALLVKLFEMMPQHVETIMSMSAFIKKAVD